MPCTGGHLACGQAGNVELCPRGFDAFAVGQTEAGRVGESVYDLTKILVSVEVEFGQEDLKLLHDRYHGREVFATASEDVAYDDTCDVVCERALLEEFCAAKRPYDSI